MRPLAYERSNKKLVFDQEARALRPLIGPPLTPSLLIDELLVVKTGTIEASSTWVAAPG